MRFSYRKSLAIALALAAGLAASAAGDPDQALKAAAADYNSARILRDGGSYQGAIDLYLHTADALIPLTTVRVAGSITQKGTNRIDRVARWYLQKTAHDIGGIYLFHSLGLASCERYTLALQYSRESATQAVAGGFPLLPGLNGTDDNIAEATKRLTSADCTVPPPARMFREATVPIPNPDPIPDPDPAPDPGPGTDPSSDPDLAADEPLQGFGATTPGGAGGVVIHVTAATDAAVRAAFRSADAGKAIVQFDVPGPIAIKSPLTLKGNFVTIEGNGVTLEGSAISATAALLDVRGHDVIVRNMRLRNGGDNLRAQGTGAFNVVFSHISSTGAMDDGISIGYGAHDVTVQYCFLAGNTRSIFMKYGDTTDVSIHHTWIMKQWIRGPLVSQSIFADLRNLIVEDWTMWGARLESASSGNVINSLFTLTPYAKSLGGKANSALRLMQSGPAFTSGNVYRGTDPGNTGKATNALPAPAVTTHGTAQMEPIVRARAGAMPRDAVDQLYIDTTTGWTVKDGRPLRLVVP
jgi:hypothetical protein